MHRSLMTLGILLLAVAALAAPARKPSSRPAEDTTQASPLAEQLMSLEAALPEAQKKHKKIEVKSS